MAVDPVARFEALFRATYPAVRRYRSLIDRLPAPQPTPPPATPDDDAAAVVEAVATLSADDQELLRLVAWDGLTPQEAAIVLGATGPQTRLRLHRARRRLRERLDAQRVPASGHFSDDREEVLTDDTAFGY